MAVIRSYTQDDRDLVLALNAAEVPRLGPVDAAELDAIVAEAAVALVAEVDGAFAGFVIVLGPGATYASPNYAYFSARHESFLYVDRVATTANARGAGVGRALYDAVFAQAAERGAPVVCAEVNVRPPNPGSLAFHAALGFTEVGQSDDPRYDGEIRVAYLEALIP